eukprot:6524954-Prymnesium_polylepis.5
MPLRLCLLPRWGFICLQHLRLEAVELAKDRFGRGRHAHRRVILVACSRCPQLAGCAREHSTIHREWQPSGALAFGQPCHIHPELQTSVEVSGVDADPECEAVARL